MRITVALSAAMLLIPPVAAFAQGATDRGDQNSNIGPAAENRDNGPYGGAPSTSLPSNQYYGPYENNGRFVKPNPSSHLVASGSQRFLSLGNARPHGFGC